MIFLTYKLHRNPDKVVHLDFEEDRDGNIRLTANGLVLLKFFKDGVIKRIGCANDPKTDFTYDNQGRVKIAAD